MEPAETALRVLTVDAAPFSGASDRLGSNRTSVSNRVTRAAV